MKHVTPICFDFNRMEVTIEKEGRMMTLVGSKEVGMCKMITGKRLQKIIKQKMTQVAQLFSIQALEEEEEEQEARSELMLVVSNSPQKTWEVNQLNLLNILLVKYDMRICLESLQSYLLPKTMITLLA